MEIEGAPSEPRAATWQHIHARTNRWVSDFEFFALEITFLQRLLLKGDIWAGKNDKAILELQRKLDSLELRRDLFTRVIKYHRSQVEAVILNPFAQEGQTIRQDHCDLLNRIVEFMGDFQLKKSAVYRLMEDTVDKDKLGHLLDGMGKRSAILYE